MTTDTAKTTPARKPAAKKTTARKTASAQPATVNEDGVDAPQTEEEAQALLLQEQRELHTHFHAFTFKGEKFYFKKVNGFEAQDYLTQLGRIGNPSIAWALSAGYLEQLLGDEQMAAFRAAEPTFPDMKVAWAAVLDHMLGDLQELEPAQVKKVLNEKGLTEEVPVPAIAGN